MARRKRELDRKEIIPDPVYNSELVHVLINVIMERGKKNIARTIVYGAIEILAKKFQGDREKAIEYFHKSLWQIAPAIEVRSRRVGGGVYQIPREPTRERSRSLAMRWLIEAASARPGKDMQSRLASELIDA